jgi:AraC family transcriptional regulator
VDAGGDSHSEYTTRMHRVLDHIDAHLDQPLSLEALAGVAHFSAFHFHRLFSAWMGETLGDYLRRRRLEVAAMRLVGQPRLAVTRVALGVGFGSSEAFARAFKARFGLSPTSWRQVEQRKRGQANRKNDQAIETRPADHEPMDNTTTIPAVSKVTIIERQPTTVAYLRHVGPYGQPLSDFWEKTAYPWLATNGLLNRPRYGISLDDPGITAPEKLRYDAAVEVAADFAGAGPYQKTTIPGGKYAAGSFQGTVAEIGPAWDAMMRDWLPRSGMQIDARPIFEYYPTDSTYDPASGVFSCDLCIPVTPL